MNSNNFEYIYNSLKNSYKNIDFRLASYLKNDKKYNIISIFRFTHQTQEELSKIYDILNTYKTPHFKIKSKVLKLEKFEETLDNIKISNENIRLNPDYSLYYPNKSSYLIDETNYSQIHFIYFLKNVKPIHDDLQKIKGEVFRFGYYSIFDLIKEKLEIIYGEGNSTYIIINFPILINTKNWNYRNYQLGGRIIFHEIYNESDIVINCYSGLGIGRDNRIHSETFKLDLNKKSDLEEGFFIKDFNFNFSNLKAGPQFKILISKNSLIKNEILLDYDKFFTQNESIDILSYFLECCFPAEAIQRKDGDPQIQQLAHFILGNIEYNSTKKVNFLDIGAGYGDLIDAINLSGTASYIIYTPMEIDKSKWNRIKEHCRECEVLEFNPPIDNIDKIDKADRIFFINVIHELNLLDRISLLHRAFELTQKNGIILIHEVIILPKLEKEFFMWDKRDYEMIISKINAKITIKSASTLTGVGGLPLQTICIKYEDDKIIAPNEIKDAIISSLEDIKKKWITKLNEGPPNEIKEQNKINRYKAFLLAQVAYASIWCEKYICD